MAKRLSERKRRVLERLIAEATVDSYSDEEALSGFHCTLTDKLQVPFKARVLGEEVEVVGLEECCDPRGVLAVCLHRGRKHRVALLDLQFDFREVKGGEWLEAYRYWLHI